MPAIFCPARILHAKRWKAVERWKSTVVGVGTLARTIAESVQ